MPVPLPRPTAEEEPFSHPRVRRSLALLNQLVSHKNLPLQQTNKFSFCKFKQNLTFPSIDRPTCDAAQLFVAQILIAELIILRFVHECDAVGFQVGFWQKTLELHENDDSIVFHRCVFQTLNLNQNAIYLHCLSKACLQKREEDTGDGYMVSRLGKTCIFSTSVHRHASGDVAYRYLIALLDKKKAFIIKKKKF